MKFSLVFIILAMLVSCGKGSDIIPKKKIVIHKKAVKEEEFAYELTGNNCTTGRHSFSTHKKACEALLKEELNNKCAQEKRLELYNSEDCA